MVYRIVICSDTSLLQQQTIYDHRLGVGIPHLETEV